MEASDEGCMLVKLVQWSMRQEDYEEFRAAESIISERSQEEVCHEDCLHDVS